MVTFGRRKGQLEDGLYAKSDNCYYFDVDLVYDRMVMMTCDLRVP